MDIIVLTHEGLFILVAVTKEMMKGIEIIQTLDCFDLCEIIRLKLTTYADYPLNFHVMNDGSGYFIGCICN